MFKRVIWALVFMLAAALLQSTILSRFVVYIRAIPDISLCILVYIAYVNGSMTGQLTGFFSGVILDFLSAAPLGLNSFIRTIIGALLGILKDTFYLDLIILPMALCAGATALKAIILFLIHLLFPETVPAYALIDLIFWIELGMNTLTAPLLFGFLKLFGTVLARPKESAI